MPLTLTLVAPTLNTSSTEQEAALAQHPNLAPRPKGRSRGPYTKASIKLASLNIRGYRNAGCKSSKWNHVNQLIREKRIGILAVQETHLNELRRAKTEDLFKKRLRIFNSEDPGNPTAKSGVAFVINKDLICTEDVRFEEIVEGRAALLQAKWHKDQRITIMAIYAPNVTQTNAIENVEFWAKVIEFLDNNQDLRIDVVLGDFNMVEEKIDRSPMRDDPENARLYLGIVKDRLRLVDGWRSTHPDTKAYSFLQDATTAQSRLDRIYVTQNLERTAREWVLEPSGIPGTDHDLVSVRVAHEDAPELGKGRWTIPPHIIGDKTLRNFMHESGMEALQELVSQSGRHNEGKNPQKIYHRWKMGVIKEARKRDRMITPRYTSALMKLSTDIENVGKDESLAENEKGILTAELKSKLRDLERQRHRNVRTKASIRNRLEGETVCKYWTQTNKEAKPRDMIYALRIQRSEEHSSNAPRYEKNSRKMAELARDYHNNLQNDRSVVGETVRERKTDDVLSKIERQASDTQRHSLAKEVTREEVLEALKHSRNDAAAGVDGIPYELLKTLNERYKENTRLGKPAFDIVQLLVAVYNDIMGRGVDPEVNFTEGWMCPLYKKNDRADIANYRPITCLNADYKLFTKVLATRLASVAPTLIHKSQAGFIQGRRIADQTKLIRMMINYAEATELNGLIVALDQEKAYDKIDHEYLWKTLRRFNLPDEFINTVGELYKHAESRVMVNGCLSSPWKITRGVRQGDPLSCLLFDLAIEPLAASLRASNLKGYSIPGYEEKLIASLFADDTTVFLSEEDNFEDLQTILDDWCIASSARFNIKKTEIIPMGTKAFRERVLRTRCTKDEFEPVPENIHIAGEGEAVRILGAWFGNNLKAEGPWSSILDKIDRYLERWEMSHPTMEGRRLIVQMVVGGITQYLTQVQGMPKAIERELTKKIRVFTWHNKRSPVAEHVLFAPKDEGGRALLDIVSRNEAINVMWLKSYLNLSPDRPLWAWVADALLALNVPISEQNVDPRVRRNIFLQLWRTAKSARTGACEDLRSLQRSAAKYGLRPDGIVISKDLLRQRPIWYHSDASQRIRYLNHGASSCLKDKHGVSSVGDAEALANILDATGHRQSNECECEACNRIESSTGCSTPHSCTSRAKELLDTLPPKWDPRSTPPRPLEVVSPELDQSGDGGEDLDWVMFEGRMTTSGHLAEIFRIFTEGEKSNELPQLNPAVETDETLQLATDGSCINNGDADARAGAGIFYSDGNPLNRGIRVPLGSAQSNQTGELLALKEAAEGSPGDSNLDIELDSKYVINLVTKDLQKNEDSGYINTANAELTRLTVARLRERRTKSRLKWVKGHTGMARNEGADALAKATIELDPTPLDLRICPSLIASGAKLSTTTQALAYKAIRGIKMKGNAPTRARTTKILDHITECAEEMFKKRPTHATIWKKQRSKDFSREARYFLWMTTHNAYMVGDHWDRPSMRQELRERAICSHCQTLETMAHILTECETTGQGEVWKATEHLWKKKSEDTWHSPVLGTILGAPLAEFTDVEGKKLPGHARLYRIIMIESAHLIWKLRCERIIQNENRPFHKEEVLKRWRKALNDRLSLDIELSKPKYGRKATEKKDLLRTWSGVLLNEASLPADWSKETGVLVGIGTDVGSVWEGEGIG